MIIIMTIANLVIGAIIVATVADATTTWKYCIVVGGVVSNSIFALLPHSLEFLVL